MALDAKTLAEIQRKAQLGIALTSPTADKQALYETTRASTDKEIARKAGAGIALTDTGSTYNTDMYNRLLEAQKEKVPVDTGIVPTGTTPTTTADTTAQSYIDQLNNAKQQAILSQLDKSRQGALSGLQAERETIQPKYAEQRGQVAAGSQQQARNFAEFMAARGGTSSGAAAQAELSRMGTLQGNLGSLGRQETAAFGDIARRESDIGTAYQSDVAGATAGIESERMQALLQDYYIAQQRGDTQAQNAIQNEMAKAQLTGLYQGQQTLGGKSLGLQEQGQKFQQGIQTKQLERSNFESDRAYEMAKGQQEWQNVFQQGQFDFQKAQQAWENTFQDKSFQQNMNEAAASRGMQWASLNQRDKEFVADQAYREKQFEYTKEQDVIQNNIAANKPADYKFDTDPVFIGAISDAGRGGLTSAQIANDAESIIADITYSGYQKLLSAAKVYESSKNILR